MTDINDSNVTELKEKAGQEVKNILEQLEKDAPGAVEGLSALLGSGIGGAASFTALSTLGFAGLSAAGITSGLATAGALVGGGMVAGIGVLAAPIAMLGITGYALAKRYKQSKLTAALVTALEKLHAVQQRLLQNAEYFKEEIAGLSAMISLLAHKLEKPA